MNFLQKLLSMALLTTYLYGGCSPYLGRISFNEVYKPSLLSSTDPFIEISSIDGSTINSIDWRVILTNNTDRYEYSISEGCDEEEYRYIPLHSTRELDLSNGFSLSLIDENGDFIDYLVINNNDVQGEIGSCNFDYDTQINSNDSSLFKEIDIYRNPDMIGRWKVSNSTAWRPKSTECTSNDRASIIYINDDGIASDDADTDCDAPNFNTINEGLESIRRSRGRRNFKLKICGGEYHESLNFDNRKFNNLVVKGTEGDVLITDNSDNLITIDNNSIENISFYNISFKHTKNTTCSDETALFSLQENKNSDTSLLSLGNIPLLESSSGKLFDFNSNNFGGTLSLNTLLDMKSPCSAISIDVCDSAKDSFEFKQIGFELTSNQTDQFGFFFGAEVDKDCPITMENISLNMHQSAGIYFQELDDFELNSFSFLNSSNDPSKDALYIERATGTNYIFDYFHIESSGEAFHFQNLDNEIELTLGNPIYRSTMLSRESSGIILETLQKANLTNIEMRSKEQGLELDVNGDLNIVDVNLTSEKCGFEFKNGNPKFDNFHIKSGVCTYSFREATCNRVDASTAFIRNSSFGLQSKGSTTFPLDWSCQEIEVTNSCFCAKEEGDASAISRNNNITANGNFWGFLPSGDIYNKNRFRDNTPLTSCPHEEFSDVCYIAKDTLSNFVAYTQKDENNISNSRFTTKKTNETFHFFVSAVDEDNSSNLLDFNGTVCFQVYSVLGNKSYTPWISLDDFKNEANTTTSIELTLSHATKEANIKFKWQQNEDKSCTDSNFNDTNSSIDSFAIIPTHFSLEINSSTMKAGDSYDLEINATDAYQNIIQDYNQTFSSIDKNATLYFLSKQRGIEENTTMQLSLADGHYNSQEFNISDVGKYTLQIIDAEYARIDQNDTNLSQRLIEGNLTIEVKPYSFDLNITQHEASTHKAWAYMSQESNESSWSNNMFYILQATLKAKNKEGEVVQAFDKDEYAFDVNTTLTFDLNLTEVDRIRYYKQLDNNFHLSSSEFNTSKERFHKGESKLELIYRIDKNSSIPMAPVRTHIYDFQLSNIGDAQTNISPLDDNITWYYAKIKTFDISTSQATQTNQFFITLYKEDTKNFKELSLNWYKNDLDDGITTSFQFNASKNTNIDRVADTTIDNISFSKGKVSFDITKNSDTKAIVHINIPPYLWYSYGLGVDYNYSASTNCSQHPCSTYIYLNEDENGYIIGSGTSSGASIEVKKRGTILRTGVKIFR